MYSYACVEEAIIGRNISNTNIKDGSRSHSWNDKNHTFDYQLNKWGVEKLFCNSDEVIIR